MAKKKKQQGHYCRICGEYKANEKFSGKGHALHVCKDCMSRKKKGVEFDPEIPVIDDEDVLGEIEYDMFNPDIDIMPPIEPEHKKYDKLNKEEKAALKELWIDIVIRYWEDERLIPFGEPYSKIKRELLDIFIDRGEIALKDDNSLKVVLHDTMIVTINKILKRENQK
ncbi:MULTISPECIES: hypothetical protein [Muribaculaceae]|jgi:hypothetical protein|uniref:hypothetical protein n=1 Tax=Muribaculaceae TaxID=2005473 RepID=UPI00244DCDA1|nr:MULTISPECIES: hypothetical protein [Bacteroidales]